jgi:hypothetical protein
LFSDGRSQRRREIAQHIAGVLGSIASWDMPGEDERDRDYVRRRILDLADLAQYIEVILEDRQRHTGHEYKVLDVGTGLGVLPLTLSSMGINASACDHSSLDVYGEWIRKEGVSYSIFDLMDGELPYANDSFDVITFKQVIEHLPFSAKKDVEEFSSNSPSGWFTPAFNAEDGKTQFRHPPGISKERSSAFGALL